MSKLDVFIDHQRQRFQEDLLELLRIPSVSSDSNHRDDVRRAGQWVADRLQKLQMKTEFIETAGHPLVLAESPPVEGAPVVLVYGHYDVQPPDPLDEWESPPFDPQVRNGNVYARGATDDKGQMLTHIMSAEAWMETTGRLPLQIKYLIEGEEEVGSQNLYDFLEANRSRLNCDVAVISDTSQFGPGQPAITYGLRGIAYYELRVKGPRQDLHSGSFGGTVTNPINALTRMLAALVNQDGRIQLPGFYDDVISMSDRERSQLQALPFDEKGYKRQIGVSDLAGEKGHTTLERRWARPTFDINGIWGGFQGEGAKTVIPARATAKFSFRLVPNQDPAVVTAALRASLAGLCPAGIEMELIDLHGAAGCLASLDSPYMTAAATAIEHGFGRSPLFIREGGSIPIVNHLKDSLGVDTLLLGWGLDDDNTHSPNEKFCLADYHRAIKASAHLWKELSRIGKTG